MRKVPLERPRRNMVPGKHRRCGAVLRSAEARRSNSSSRSCSASSFCRFEMLIALVVEAHLTRPDHLSTDACRTKTATISRSINSAAWCLAADGSAETNGAAVGNEGRRAHDADREIPARIASRRTAAIHQFHPRRHLIRRPAARTARVRCKARKANPLLRNAAS